jgi:dolichol-phosphate mannosyltransferase
LASDQTGSDAALSVVVPCYNEEDVVSTLYTRLTSVCRTAVGDRYEIVLVDDGSTDRTWSLIQDLAERDAHIIGVRLSRNHGHQLALTAGLSTCRGGLILIIDADLQDPPELLPDMMQLVRQGADVVYGQRKSRSGESWHKRATASIFYRILGALTDVPIPPDTGDFRLMTRRALDVLQSMPEQHRFIRGMVSWIGFHQVPIHYDRAERWAGSTKYPFHRMLRLAIDAITGFSTRPLRLSLYLSGVLGLTSVALLAYTLYSWLFLDVVHGWTSLMGVVLMLGCTQMLMLGIMGEYLGRLYMQSKRRPLFVIADVARMPESAVAARPVPRLIDVRQTRDTRS